MDILPGTSHDDPSEIKVSFRSISSSRDSLSVYSNMDPDVQWTRTSVRQLITVVQNHFEDFYDRTIKKKVLWKRIASDMRQLGVTCSPDECDKKWRNLKKSYITVLKKQTQGDFTSRLFYFDQMHSFVGKEIDPLGLREQAMKMAITEQKTSENNVPQRALFFEVAVDDKFEWNESAVHSLMNLILEHKESFEFNKDYDVVWESIEKKMNLNGHEVAQEQCQRKWVNLAEGFKHYQAEAEVSGCPPDWTFFNRVRTIMNTLNVPVTLGEEPRPIVSTLKGSLSSASQNKYDSSNNKRRKPETDAKSDSEEEQADMDDPASVLTHALRSLEKNLKVEKRLQHLEARVEAAQMHKAAIKHSNNLLTSILSELKRINKSLEERKKKLGEERLKPNDLVDGVAFDETPIVDEEEYQQTLFNMSNFAKFHLMKAPKVEVLEGAEPDGITVFVE